MRVSSARRFALRSATRASRAALTAARAARHSAKGGSQGLGRWRNNAGRASWSCGSRPHREHLREHSRSQLVLIWLRANVCLPLLSLTQRDAGPYNAEAARVRAASVAKLRAGRLAQVVFKFPADSLPVRRSASTS